MEKKNIKMQIQVSDEKKYNSVNVRDDNGDIIGQIKNRSKVDVLGDCSEGDRVPVKGVQMGTRKKITGTVLTSCLKAIE